MDGIRDEIELRILFAGVAMHAMLSSGCAIPGHDGVADEAFKTADAMIRRAKGKE